MGGRDVRTRVIDAALAEVTEHGWEATSLARVRKRAGVSNGSLFHHFPTRADLQAAVLSKALADHQANMLGILARSRTARSGVRNVVRAHLDWIVGNPHLAMLVLSALPAVLRDQVDHVTRGENVQFFDDVARWFESHGWSGTPHIFVMIAIWVGPTNELTRNMSQAAESPPRQVVEALADAAWHALSPHLGTEEP